MQTSTKTVEKLNSEILKKEREKKFDDILLKFSVSSGAKVGVEVEKALENHLVDRNEKAEKAESSENADTDNR